MSTLGIEKDRSEPINKRAKVDTGTHCNYNCSFCYYSDRLDEVTPYEVICDRIDYVASCGINEVDLSGGESSIHNNWFDILDYCASKGLMVSTLSNGYRFADRSFTHKSYGHGLREILFSLHGFDEESHDRMVGHKYAFRNIIQAIHNANEVGMLVRVNCTVTYDNYEGLDKFAELVNGLGVYEVNFLPLNYWDDANDIDKIDYNLIIDNIKSSIISLQVDIINVRYIPYCYMKGYEEYVCDIYQHIYDIYDWNIALYNMDINSDDYKDDPIHHLYLSARDNRCNSYYKKDECKNCKHYYICDGLEKGLDIEVHPEEGQYIKDVNYYRKGYYETTNKKG